MISREALTSHLIEYLGDNEATLFCLQLWDVIQLWDDLIDKGQVTDSEINKVFITMMIEMPKNNFYAAFGNDLRPLMMSAYLQWQTANVFEKEGQDEDLNKAYMLRSSFYNIVHYCVYAVHGAEAAEQTGPDILRIYGEKLTEFKEEMICQIQ